MNSDIKIDVSRETKRQERERLENKSMWIRRDKIKEDEEKNE